MAISIIRAKEIALACLTVKQPLLLIGSPGMGKSDLVRQIAEEKQLSLIDLRLSQLSEVDLRGVPSVVNGLTEWNPPKFLPTSGTGILFLDELPAASPAVQIAAYQLILDRRLGDYILPDGWTIFAAGNRVSDGAIVNRMSTALKNRFLIIESEVDVKAWLRWAVAHAIHPYITGFIQFRPTLLNIFDNDKLDTNAMSYATPRSWEKLSRLIPVTPSDSVLRDVAAGLVGQGTSAEFMAFVKTYMDLPSFAEIISSPLTAKLPTKTDGIYAICAMLTHRVTANELDAVMPYVSRMNTEYQITIIRALADKDRLICSTQAFAKFAQANADVLFA